MKRVLVETIGTDRDIVGVGHRVVHGGPLLLRGDRDHGRGRASRSRSCRRSRRCTIRRTCSASVPRVPPSRTCRTSRCSTPPSTRRCRRRRTPTPSIAEIARALPGAPLRVPRHLAPVRLASEAARFLGRPLEELRIIVLHLGNGASVDRDRGGTVDRHVDGAHPARGSRDGHPRRATSIPACVVPPAPAGWHGRRRARRPAQQAQRAARAHRHR